MGVSPVIIHFLLAFCILNHPFMGYPHLWKPLYQVCLAVKLAERNYFRQVSANSWIIWQLTSTDHPSKPGPWQAGESVAYFGVGRRLRSAWVQDGQQRSVTTPLPTVQEVEQVLSIKTRTHTHTYIYIHMIIYMYMYMYIYIYIIYV